MTIPKINNNNQTIKLNVNENGAVEINSLKGTSLFEVAKSYDNIINNDLLEGEELVKFLNETTKNRALKTQLEVVGDEEQYIYYEQKDKEGNLVKRCIVTKDENDMMTFMFKNNKPVKCINYMSDGTKDIIDLKTGVSSNIDTKTNKKASFTLNSENCAMLRRIALDKPAKFDNWFEESIYRLVNWDWGNW